MKKVPFIGYIKAKMTARIGWIRDPRVGKYGCKSKTQGQNRR